MKKEIDESRHYIKSEDFFTEQMRCLKTQILSTELGEMFMLLASRYANHSNFVRYWHIRDDLIMAGVEACCRDWKKFRPNRNILTRDEEGEIISSEPVYWDGKDIDYHHELHYNPLAFYTTTIRRAFMTVIKKEYNQRNIVNQLLVDNDLEADEGYLEMVRNREERERNEAENSKNKKTPDTPKKAAIIWD